MKAIVLRRCGGPEVLTYEDAPAPSPKVDEALVRVAAIGVNFIDVYHRTGLYPLKLPLVPGMEAAGTIVEVGADVKDFKAGDRVAWAFNLGAYAEQVVAPAVRLVKIPDGIDFQTAAAAMLQGMTAHYLTRSTYALKSGDAALVHAAAGGVGLLLVQMAKRIGARVIGKVSTEAKAELARQAGADHVILYTRQDFETETRRITEGRGVQVVYDSVGRDTFTGSMNSPAAARHAGAVRAIERFGPANGSGAVVAERIALPHTSRPYGLHRHAGRTAVARGRRIARDRGGRTEAAHREDVSLAEAARAHADLEGRKTTGKLLLIPQAV